MARRKATSTKVPRRRKAKAKPSVNSNSHETPHDEILVRKLFALDHLGYGTPTWLIQQKMCSHFEGLTSKQADYSYSLAMVDVTESIKKGAKTAADAQVNRLKMDLAEMRDLPVGQKRNWGAIARHETVLARIEGNNKPVRVELGTDVTHHDALSAILGGETAGDFEKRIERVAARRRALADSGVVLDTTGNVVH